MIKNNGCCDLKYAKKLKELGVKQEGVFCYWQNATTKEWNFSNHLSHSPSKALSAFTVAELLNISPDDITYFKCTLKGSTIYNAHQGFDKHIEADTMADAIAKMLIWLIENKMMEVWSEH